MTKRPPPPQLPLGLCPPADGWHRPVPWPELPLLAGLFFLLAHGASLVASRYGNASPIWPASGLAVWWLIHRGWRAWPGILIGAAAARLLQSDPVPVTLLIPVGNVTEALLGAWLVHLRLGSGTFNTVRRAKIVFAALIAPIPGAAIAAAVLALSGSIPTTAIRQVATTWWIGDFIGILLLVPFLEAFGQLRKRADRARSLLIGTGFALLSGGVTWFLIWHRPDGIWLFAIFPTFLAALAWGGVLGISVSMLAVAAVAITATVHQAGPFVTGNVDADLARLQVFLAVTACTALMLDHGEWRVARRLGTSVLLVGWLISGLIFAQMQLGRQQRDESILRVSVDRSQTSFRDLLQTYTDTLRGAAALVAAHDGEISVADWHAYVDSLDLDTHYPGVSSIGWVDFVADTDFEAYLERKRRTGRPDFSPRQVLNGTGRDGVPERYILSMLAPTRSNTSALGYDISTESSRRDAARLSRDSGQPTISRPIELIRPESVRLAFVLYVPCYRMDMPRSTVEQRRQALLGWVDAPFITSEFVIRAMNHEREGLELVLFQTGADGRSREIFRSAHYDSNRQPALVSHLAAAGADLTLHWQRGPDFPPTDPAAALWAACGLTIITLLLAGWGVTLHTSAERAQALARERTAELTTARNRLEARSGLQRAILDGTSYSIIASDINGVITDANHGAEVLLGFPREELLGCVSAETIHFAHEIAARAAELSIHTAQPVAASSEALFLKARQGFVDEREWTYRRKDGSHLPVRLTITAIHDDAGELIGFIEVARDHSNVVRAEAAERALVASEERLEQVLERADCLLWEATVILTPDDWIWDLKVLSSALLRWLHDGQKLPEEAGLWHLFEIPEQVEMNRRARAAMEGGKPGYVQEFRVQRDGITRWIQESVSIAPRGDKRFFLVGVATDITEQKHLEQNLAKALDDALDASRMKSAFVANMSHEIRTPMNGILGVSEVLSESPLADDQRHLVGVIRNSGESLLRIIDDILDFSKIESGRLDLDQQEFELRNAISETVILLGTQARKKGLELVLDLDDRLDGAWLGDAGRLRQVITNLLGNAIKFTAAGRVTVRALRADRPPTASDSFRPTRVRIEVQDTGIGIPEAARRHLFEPFMQADASTTRRFGGTGLGLAISRKLVDLMGGTLAYDSIEGVGTTFHIELTLPHRPGSRNPPPGFAAPVPPTVLTAVTGTRAEAPLPADLRIFVVEDNPANRLVARTMLETLNLRVDFAENGRDALDQLARDSAYDAILMDCQMPEMDGYETTRRIRAGAVPGLRADIPIFALTAYAMQGDRERCIAAGMNDHLTKPLRLFDLRRLVERIAQLPPEIDPVPAPGEPVNASPAPGEQWVDRGILEILEAIPSKRGLHSLFHDLVVLLAETMPDRLAALARAADTRDAQALAHEAHILAGSAASVGTQPLREVCVRLETQAEAKQWTKILPTVQEVITTCHRTLENLERIRHDRARRR